MRLLILVFILTSLAKVSSGQPTEKMHSDTLNCPDPVFFVKFTDMQQPVSFPIGKRDTVDYGTDGAPGKYAIIYYGTDSLRINNTQSPYFQVHYIPIKHLERTIIYRLHFNNIMAFYSTEYIKRNSGKVQIDVPEIYELANILLALSKSGQKQGNMDKTGEYYDRVVSYFKPFLNHPVFENINFPDSLYYKNYYNFRENSLCFNFSDDKIVPSEQYFYIMGNDDSTYTHLFKTLLPQIEHFAKISNFRQFYQNNSDFYKNLIDRQNQLIPVKNMWTWIEGQFPKPKFHSYRIVFSPIIQASHSTQQFHCFNKKTFSEIVMFVSGPSIYDRNAKLIEKQKEGLLSGIVFTEIDHNYVNPRSDDFAETIDSIFSKRSIWTSQKADNKFYSNPMSVYNEYMTHALYSIYVIDFYEKKIADFLISERETLMVERRGFIKFKAFNERLISLKAEYTNLTVSQLYPFILNWCKTQIQ